MQKIPIFIISCNRLKVLKESIDSFAQLTTPFEIVIHDNNSTYTPLKEYLYKLQRQGVTVYYNSANINQEDQLNNVSITIENWFENNDAPYYVVTDPDIALCSGCSDMLELYAYILSNRPDIEVVGPMLRIDDLPDYYPLKAKAIQRHTEQFWHKTPLLMQWYDKSIQYQDALIDTTFGMYRKGFKFHRLCNGIRTYSPYWARHLDWYINPNEMTNDQIYYLKNASNVSHWGGAWLREKLFPKSILQILKDKITSLVT